MTKELIMYTRTAGCPFVTIAKRTLAEHAIPYREIYIDQDDTARERMLAWVGFLSVPTLVIADAGEDVPYTEPDFLEAGLSPRGINRGSMLTEPNARQLRAWLVEHGLLSEDAKG